MTVSDWRLRDEREFLRRSLDDAEREHEAGDLSDEDYALLRGRDERRLEEVEAALAAAAEPAEASSPASARGADADAERRARRRLVFWRRRWWLAAGGVALLALASVLLVMDLTKPRLPGQYATGSVTLNTSQRVERQLAQAQQLLAQNKQGQALSLYGSILTEDPHDPVALAEWGWLDWRAAGAAHDPTVAAEGASALEESVHLDPKLFVGQYYLGAVLLQQGDAPKAVTHFKAFLGDHPSAHWLKEAAPEVRTAYKDAHRPVPAGLPKS